MRRRVPFAGAAGFALCAALPGPAAFAEDARPARPSDTDGSLHEALNRNLPLTPGMIEELRQRYMDTRRAGARMDDPSSYVTPMNRRINWSLRPGEATPILHAAAGYPTVVSFFDNTGRPWPIAGESNSNPSTPQGGAAQAAAAPPGREGQNGAASGAGGRELVGDFAGFAVHRPVPGGNSIEITVRTPFPRGGLVVYLQDAAKPVTFMLVSGRGQYDASASVHVAARGPRAEPGVVVRMDAVETGGPHMTQMLDGITPAGARAAQVAGGSADDFRAWRMGEKLYLRTTANLLAPEPDAYQFAEGGVRVYSMPAPRHGAATLLMSDGTRNFPVSIRGD